MAPSVETVTVKESPLPLLGDDPLSPAQWATLLAFADAVVPSIAPSATANPASQLAIGANDYATRLANVQQLAGPDVAPELSAQYLAETPSACPAFRENIQRLMAQYIPADVRKQLLAIFGVLNTRPGALVMTGYSTPFAEQPVNIRIAILQNWMTARTPMFRQLNKMLTSLIKQNWAKSSAALGRVLGFPRVPVHGSVGKGFNFEFIQMPPGVGPETIETDIVIVGSGCGAGVCAKNFAEAGHRVIVVEKSYYWPPEHLPMKETDGFNHLFMNGGFVISDDTSVSVAAGQTFGGGGFVNWSASLQTQGAKRVVIAGGTMQSPLLLLRSGLKNPNIGRHLHLHPVSFLGAVHKERTDPWEGGILTSVVNEFENLDGKGHGAKLEAVTMLPSVWLTVAPWVGGLEYKDLVPRMKHMAGYFALARDRDTGRVYPDPLDGRCRLSYTLSRFDKKSLLEGVVGLAKLQYVAESEEEDPEGTNNERFQAWLKDVRRTGLPQPETMFMSAHQMGTCLWGTEGLYVADASVFPSASGVNPMVTVMGIADWLSRNISARMAREKEVAKL
ncbi:hypothetical protein SLS55_005323 [Diplodia seriata]|uniref:long-chain-alcohol oxidase n=1 Tax=Diplodia seriata TaxID=420778 RepID=A0ABR3CG21_9PEZI